jgi:hypothetical protein
MSTAPIINLGDRETALDLAAFLRRAKSVNDDGARVTVTPYDAGALTPKVAAGRLDVCVPIITRGGLLDHGPEIFAVRSWRIASIESVDAVYENAALLDRLERGEGIEWPVPPSEIHRSWAGQSIPREGWHRAGTLSAEALRSTDREGSQRIADSLPADPGQAMVNQARRAVWGEGAPDLGGLPAGVGFAAVRLAFLGDAAKAPESVPVHQREGHVLVSLPFGSVVVRIPGLPGAT